MVKQFTMMTIMASHMGVTRGKGKHIEQDTQTPCETHTIRLGIYMKRFQQKLNSSIM